MASANPSSVFTEGWSWLVAQSVYDNVNRELIKSLDQVHFDINNDLDSQIAYQLIKSDLIKELVCFTCALIDASTAKQKNISLVYSSAEPLATMIEQDQFSDYSTIGYLRRLPDLKFRARVRYLLAIQHRKYVRKRVSRVARAGAIGLNLNPLGHLLSTPKIRRIKFLMPDLIAARPSDIKTPDKFANVAENVLARITKLLVANNIELSERAASYLQRTINGHFHNAWADFSMKSQISGVGNDSVLLTGTGGNYPARVISHQFWKNGATVIRTTHGGDVPMFMDYVVPTVEIPFSSTFVVMGDAAASAYRNQILTRSEAKLPMYPGKIEAAGSATHSAIWNRSSIRSEDSEPKRITVIAASFLGSIRAIPHKKMHDVVYLEWHRRLLKMLSTAGYSVLSKRHPKGLLADQKIFSDTVSNESILEPISAVEDNTDVYVIDTPGSALIDALCTKKQVILIDFPVKIITEEARKLLSAAAVVIRAEFDEKNRIIIDPKELIDAINTPVNIDAREKLVNSYFLSSSPGISNIREVLGSHGR